ncbi:MAG: putative integral rane protein [Blastococcus sp.]|nr:putative integral rane protein [Blastococcus sp.]
MLLQLRVTVPPDRTGQVRDLFEKDPGTAHLAVLTGASVSPAGDLVLADVARESADGLVAALRDLDVHRDGAIAITSIDAAVSGAARRAEERAPGDGADAVVWEQVVRTTDADSALSVSYLAFLTIATLLAGIAIINDSAILTIGAMVLGPEFVPLAALAVAAVQHRPASARRALVTLVAGFAVAIAITAAATLVGRGLGWFGPELLGADRPQTGFITSPDRWSLVVAVLAGVAGVLSLTSAKSGALVGVFISVTTVPAAADMAISLALGGGAELRSAATQLGINLAGIIVAATLTLALQRAVWRRVPRAVPRAAAVGPD